MWFKKKSVLQAEGLYNTDKSADGTTDMRTTIKDYSNSNSSINNSGFPFADAGNYFYLPALGYYRFEQLKEFGGVGCYWSSSALPWHGDDAYSLGFRSGLVSVSNNYRNNGFRVGGFE